MLGTGVFGLGHLDADYGAHMHIHVVNQTGGGGPIVKLFYASQYDKEATERTIATCKSKPCLLSEFVKLMPTIGAAQFMEQCKGTKRQGMLTSALIIAVIFMFIVIVAMGCMAVRRHRRHDYQRI